MKKLFLVLAAAFAMVACQSDINEVGVAGGEVDVTFEVGTPTRAYSDGTTATRLQYAIYDETGAELTALTKTDATINITATVSFKLVTGNKYTAIFWADNDDAPYTVNLGAKTMTVDYTGVACNNEKLDAFYAKHEFTVKGAQTETIELRRPFAQLNIGTNDYAAATEAGYTPEYSAVTVKNIFSTLNLWDGSVDNAVEVNFDYAQIAKSETFPVTGYQYLAMNYLLVPAEKEVVDIEFGYGESSTAAEKTRTVGSVPVQRNYRTNIYGQLLTSDVDINVVINPEYEGVHNGGAASGNVTYVENLAELQAALAMPAAEKGPHHYIYFTADIAGDATILQTADLCLVIDGQGHKFDGTFLVNGNARSTGAETLTFQNIAFESATAKTFISAPSKINDRYNYSHNVTVKDCSFKGNWANGVEVGGVSLTGTYHPAILNCTADNMHSLCQFQSVDNDIRIEDVTITNGKNGIALGNAANVTIKNANVTAEYYGIRADGNGDRGNLVIEESTIEAKQPIVVRKVTTPKYAITLGANVTLTTAEFHHVVFTTGSDDAAYVAPADANYSIEGADALKVFPRDLNLIPIIENNIVAPGVGFDPETTTLNANGDVTSYTTILVNSAEGLQWVANNVNNTSSVTYPVQGKTIKLLEDITLPDGFYPIGYNPTNGNVTTYEGTFDGKGNTIKNLKQQNLGGAYKQSVGLFAKVHNTTIKNLVVEDFSASIYGAEAGVVATWATGDCTFEGITVKNGDVVAYNCETGGVVGWAESGNFTFKDITVGSDVTVSSLWNSYDTPVGGVIGGVGNSNGYTMSVTLENINVACQLDVYNDVSSNYQWGAYRRAGMLIGTIRKTQTIGGTTYPDPVAEGVTCSNVTVTYGKWMNYHYCEFKSNGHGSYDDDQTWKCSRVEGSDWGSKTIDTSKCQHESFESHNMCLPIDQLFGGGQGVYGLATYDGVTVNYPAEYTCPSCGQQHNVGK